MRYQDKIAVYMVLTGTGNQGKPGKMGRHFPVREKSGNFVKTGKVREIRQSKKVGTMRLEYENIAFG